MIRFLIVSHGYLADGFKSATEIIMGKDIAERIYTINAFVGDCRDDVKGDLETFVGNVPIGDKLIIFSDIMHGSVNQFLMPLVDDEKVYLITGVNFPLICELIAKYCFSDETTIDNEEMLAIVEKAKDEMKFMNHYLSQVVLTDDENNFFE